MDKKDGKGEIFSTLSLALELVRSLIELIRLFM